MGNQTSLYLKYRPIQLDDVVGQRNVVATLKQASLKKDFAHAYLLSGNHGCGKTSTARILATLMECENVQDGKVCGQCRPCKAIHIGAAADVIELDGASNRGIDNVKSIIDAAQWSPQELKRKVYLIDECHCLTKEANSALLKILEEPPSYVSFILCTTEINKILPTILSRCQRFNFNKISSKEIAQRLSFIAKKENIKIEDAGINIIAKIARGSMRDAVGYLEQIGTVAAEKNIAESHVQKYFGVTDRIGILNIVKAIIDSNIALILDQVNDMIMASSDCRQIMYEISDVFRNIMVLKAQKGDSRLVDLPDNEIEDLKKLGESLKITQILKLAHLFADVEKKMSFNINERWIMEATLINCVASLRKETV
jgi:DNA polymerase-3 subunit gamma/tau